MLRFWQAAWTSAATGRMAPAERALVLIVPVVLIFFLTTRFPQFVSTRPGALDFVAAVSQFMALGLISIFPLWVRMLAGLLVMGPIDVAVDATLGRAGVLEWPYIVAELLGGLVLGAMVTLVDPSPGLRERWQNLASGFRKGGMAVVYYFFAALLATAIIALSYVMSDTMNLIWPSQGLAHDDLNGTIVVFEICVVVPFLVVRDIGDWLWRKRLPMLQLDSQNSKRLVLHYKRRNVAKIVIAALVAMPWLVSVFSNVNLIDMLFARDVGRPEALGNLGAISLLMYIGDYLEWLLPPHARVLTLFIVSVVLIVILSAEAWAGYTRRIMVEINSHGIVANPIFTDARQCSWSDIRKITAMSGLFGLLSGWTYWVYTLNGAPIEIATGSLDQTAAEIDSLIRVYRPELLIDGREFLKSRA